MTEPLNDTFGAELQPADAPETTEAATEETTETPAVKSRRGRPRPEATIERDKQVLEQINADGATRAELVERTGLAQNQVYLSLFRLRKDGLVERSREGSSHRWVLTQPADDEQPALLASSEAVNDETNIANENVEDVLNVQNEESQPQTQSTFNYGF